MTFDISPAVIFQAFTTGLIAVVAFMLRGVYKDFQKAMETIADHKIRLALLEEKVERLENNDD